MPKIKKAEPIKELCKKYDNILPVNKKKIPLLGEANCTK